MILAELCRHHRFANLLLFDRCVDLSDEQLDATIVGTHGTIRKTLQHLAVGEQGYLAAMGEPPAQPVSREFFPGVEALREALADTGERLIAFAERTDGDPIVTGMRYGEPFSLPISVFFGQSINHGADHRSQIATTLTQIGIEPPEMDYWAYLSSK